MMGEDLREDTVAQGVILRAAEVRRHEMMAAIASANCSISSSML